MNQQKIITIIKNMTTFLIAIFFLGILVGGGLFAYYAVHAPEISEEDLIGQRPSKIYDRQGQLVIELGGETQDLMTEEEIPAVLRDAVLAIEDARFYKHNGIDPVRIGGALIENIRQGDIAQGGSTITQQLVKLSVFSTDFSDQTLERKAQEAWLSLQLEQELSKDEILTLYLNKLYYSNNTYGAKTAARKFFDKSLDQLSISEAALLAGIPQAPSLYDPYNYSTDALERRDLVLSIMLNRGMISQEEYDQAQQTSMEEMLVPLKDSEDQLYLDAYLDLINDEVQEVLDLDIYTGGLEIHTLLDDDAQKELYELVNHSPSLAFPNDQVQTAVAVIDNEKGELMAVVGGRKQEVQGALNRAKLTNRSIASTIKPLSDYGPAFEYLDYSTGETLQDEPYSYSDGHPIENYDYGFKGSMTLREALVDSRNIPALKTFQEVGADRANQFLKKLGIHITNDNQQKLVEANAIGGEASPVQLAAAYSAIANLGNYQEPKIIDHVLTASGKREDFSYKQETAMKESTAYMLIDVLKDIPGNFALAADVSNIFHAGKTGTTNYTHQQLEDFGLYDGEFAAPDGWYAGFSPQYTISAWVGYDNPYEGKNYLTLEDTRLPQTIYAEMMEYLMIDQEIYDWKRPENVVEVQIEKYTVPNLLPGPRTPEDMKSWELFVAGTQPTEQSLVYGRQLEPPSTLTAEYDETNKNLVVKWSGNLEGGQYELLVNDQWAYQGTETSYTISNPQEGVVSFALRIVDGNSSSDYIYLEVTITHKESSSESDELSSSESDESSSKDESLSLDEDDETRLERLLEEQLNR